MAATDKLENASAGTPSAARPEWSMTYWLGRLRRWWSGGSGFVLLPPPAGWLSRTAAADSLDRLDLVQRVWGWGHLQPGGDGAILDLLGPEKLPHRSHLLLLGAGLGGPAAALTQGIGCRVTALEPSSDAVAKSQTQGPTGKPADASSIVRALDPALPSLPPHRFPIAIAFYATSALQTREPLFRSARTVLKRSGRLILLDFTLTEERPTPGELAAAGWTPGDAPPWQVAQYTECLKGAGFSCGSPEDWTLRVRGEIVTAWARAIEHGNLPSLGKAELAILLAEGELWSSRVRLIDSGKLAVTRIMATAG